jgi:hypothetical protein
MRNLYNLRMPYQFKREPLTQDEATRLANACQSHQEKRVAGNLVRKYTLSHKGLCFRGFTHCY